MTRSKRTLVSLLVVLLYIFIFVLLKKYMFPVFVPVTKLSIFGALIGIVFLGAGLIINIFDLNQEKLINKGIYLYYLVIPVICILTFIIYKNQKEVISNHDVRFFFVMVLLACFVLAGYLIIIKKWNLNYMLLMILFMGIILRLCYALYSHYNVRQHDIFGEYGHLDYIKHVANHLFIPPSGTGQYYHPPVHYMIFGYVYRLGMFFRLGEEINFRLLQFFGVILSSIALIFVYKSLRLTGISKFAAIVGLAFFVFHPYSVYSAVYLNNDGTTFFFSILSFYFLLRWCKEKSIKNVAFLAFFTMLAMMSKKSGFLILPIIGLVFLLDLIRDRKIYKNYIKPFAVFLMILIPIPVIIQIRSYVKFNQSLFFCPEPGLDGYENSLYNLFYFPLKTFLKKPFTGDPFNDVAQNRFFTEYVFKSSIFGEFRYPGLESIAQWLLAAAFIVTLIIMIAFFMLKKKNMIYGAIFLLNIVVPLGLHLKFRIELPFVCTQNFRYLLITILTGAFFTGIFASRFEKHKILRYISILPILMFCILSSIFILKIGFPG